MIGDLMEIAGVAVLAFFVIVNLVYFAFTIYAYVAIPRHLRSREYSGEDEAFASPLSPGISVIVPAYNEEAGIVESVHSLRRLRYPKLEIIVVSDGSTDGTVARLVAAFDLVPVRLASRGELEHAAVVATWISRADPGLVLLEKENGGKADAQNAGADLARHDYLCIVDADAVLEPDALLRVAQPALDDRDAVIASGGMIRVANGCRIVDGQVVEVGLPSSRLAVFQVVEYFRAFLVGRVAWSAMNALMIISGAFGLYRRDAVVAAGGWWEDTVGEDAEMVFRLHRLFRERGEEYRIEFVPDPVSWTECPEDLAVLSRQRRRWHRGLFESLARHRRMLFNPRYGTVGLSATPYFLLFELLGPIVEAIGYLVLPVVVVFDLLAVDYLIAFLALSVGLGMFLSFAALTLEEFSFQRHHRHREIGRMLLYSVLENFGYRQLMSLIRLRAFIDIARGETSWGAMPRKGLSRSL